MTSDHNKGGPERRSAIIGFTLALALTLGAFGIVELGSGSPFMILGLVALLAVLQIIVHLRFFLHLDLSKSRREDLQLILFATLLIVLMVGGSIWILWSLHMRMMPV
ncbi:MAG: cytochrome o ubiquinol oxidase subunit IV [Aestuariivirga sp.]